MPKLTFPGTTVGFSRLRYWVSNWVHQLNPVPEVDLSEIVKSFPRLTFMGFSQGALSQMLAEASAIDKKTMAKTNA